MRGPIIPAIIHGSFQIVPYASGDVVSVGRGFIVVFRRQSSLFINMQTRRTIEATCGYDVNAFRSLAAAPCQNGRVVVVTPFVSMDAFMNNSNGLFLFNSIPGE